MTSAKDDETLPLGVFLVKSDSKEEKLLFRFPYSIDETKESIVNKQSKYAIIITEDTFNKDDNNSIDKPIGKAQQMPSYSDLTSSISTQMANTSTNETIAK